MGFGKKASHHNRRRYAREDVMLAASAMSVTRSRSVVVADVSAIGARLGGFDLPMPGDDLLMVVGTQDRMATVVWRYGNNCGIRLDEPLQHGNIALMKQEAAWGSVTGWER